MRGLILVSVSALLASCYAKNESRIEYIGRLKRDLFKDYDSAVIPLAASLDGKTGLDVSVGLNQVYMDMNDKGHLDMSVWLSSSWIDERLAWDPKEYHDIDSIRVPAHDIWIPDLEVYNNLEHGPGYINDVLKSRSTNTLVMSNGMVIYIPAAKLSVPCNDEEFANWPWGEYDCSIKLGSWAYSGYMINLQKYENKNYITTESVDEATSSSPVFFTENSFQEDSLINKFYPCCPEPYPALHYKFKVQRGFRIGANGKELNPSPVPAYKPEEN
ncbi:acetylcholine receptor subunit alpha-type acr-16 [Eurytemora carolleeae]|uniref:acetylcholine receptor subunit alpha-type acr-16 n=1 Tax=Eurytemora carolleeae TaxID=1294199 RepID=UPI000C793565|nr:acetylcholine receptor subunit alpha-type acr-16 [Eurytemora carolleeae]|eukprot:XP_023323717.1 acetylcholine receptor subunit alpha-type acr-16-like [Eurytemora affinis]